MRSIFDPEAPDAFRKRIGGLRPDTQPRWGRMNASQMVCHLIDAVEIGLGEAPVTVRPGHPLRLKPLRLVFIYLLPWPRGRVPTLPEFQMTRSSVFETDVARWSRALDRLLDRGRRNLPFGVHPAFGRMSRRETGWLFHQHFDHHFRQFGI